MDKRLTGFMVLAVAIIAANQIIYLFFFPPKPLPKPEPVAVVEAPLDADQPQPAQADAGVVPAPVEPAVNRPQEIEPAKTVPPQHLALGSADPASPYRMLVILNNRGAAIERLELNSPRYRDLEDRSGYLGYLSASDAPGRKGAVVGVVGAGTPAFEAGLKPGDVITSVDERPVTMAVELAQQLNQTEPSRSVEIVVQRDGQVERLTAELRRQPLAVIKPEWHSKPVSSPDTEEHDPLSFLLTLQQLDDRVLDDSDGELGGVDLQQGIWEVASADAGQVSFRRTLTRLGLEVTKTYKLAEVPADNELDPDYPAYNLTLAISIANIGDKPHSVAYRLDGPTGLPIEGAWYAIKVSRSWGSAGLRDVIVHFQGGQTEQVTPAEIVVPDFKKNWANSPLDFIAVDAQYFAASLLPLKENPTDVWFSSVRPRRVGAIPDDKVRKSLTDISFRLDSLPTEIKPGGAAFVHEFQLFAGPKRPELLQSYGPSGGTLNELVYYGWFGPVSRTLLAILHAFHAVIGNFGIAIMMLTVLVKLCMVPISRKQAMGAQKMAELQPEVKKLTEKYKNEPEKKMKAQQELFRAHNYNPLGGCLVGFVQIPIFMGLYRSLQVDVELRGSPLISESIRWASNLVAPDMLWDWAPMMPHFVTHGTGIFALGPYFNLLPIGTVLLMIISQKMTLPPPADEQAALQQKMMQYMMIFIGIMFFKVAAGLCVYLITSSVWSIAERQLLPKSTKIDSSGASGLATVRTGDGGNGSPPAKKRQRR